MLVFKVAVAFLFAKFLKDGWLYPLDDPPVSV